MIVERTITIGASAADTFRHVADIPFVGSCLPGASDIRPDGEDTYAGTFGIKVGPVKVNLEGSVAIIESDAEERRLLIRLRGTDRRIGGDVIGDMHLDVVETAEDTSQLNVRTELLISGKLGQFGQAVMTKKADQITEGFVAAFSQRITEDLAVETRLVGASGPLPAEVGAPAPAPYQSATTGESALARPASWSTDGVEALQAIMGLLRRGRRIGVVESAADLTQRSGAARLGQLWLSSTALADGVSGSGLGGRDYLVEIEVRDADEMNGAWRALGAAQLGAPVAVAVLPTGRALADPAALQELAASTASTTGRPVLLVAATPWSVLSLARLVEAGAAHGVVVDVGSPDDRELGTLMRLALVEVRRADLGCPIFAGPAHGSGAEAAYRAAGADAVLVSRRRGPLAWRRRG